MTRRRRCAVYTRKSSEEGLSQDFNSLDAQREACLAYVLSQKHEGWMAVPGRYEDGGISGGTMKRPGLIRLLADVEAGRINVVVVYKVDRLTRSLADFAKIVDLFDAHGVSFVSVTQAFNTTSSMGRLTLNVLLSFAQFEREVTAERIRDKIAASKKKGMWMGGVPPLGYDVKDRALVVNADEAKTVRLIFDLYAKRGVVKAVSAELNARGLKTKRVGENGGKPFAPSQIHSLLRNPVYVGRVRHQGKSYPGQHPAIVDQALWRSVQARLDRNGTSRGVKRSAAPRPLLGKLFDGEGRPMAATHAKKGAVRYRYYVSKRSDAEDAPPWRLPAARLERAIDAALRTLLLDRRELTRALLPVLSDPARLAPLLHMASERAGALSGRMDAAAAMLTRIDLTADALRLEVDPAALRRAIDPAAPPGPALSPSAPAHVLSVPLELRRRGVETKIVIQGEDAASAPGRRRDLLEAIAKARQWWERLLTEPRLTQRALSAELGVAPARIAQTLPLAFLAPSIVEGLAKGGPSSALGPQALARLVRARPHWADQVRAVEGSAEQGRL